ncbi:sensor histidine kinase [Pseudomonas aestuarii]
MLRQGWRTLRQAAPVRRNLLLLFLPWALLILLLTALLYERLLAAKLDPLLHDQQSSLTEGVGVLNRHLATQRGNLKFLSLQPLLARVLDESTQDNLHALGQLFLEFSASTGVYDQIRWLDEYGMERVRVDLREGQATLRDSAQLQNKADRYYFAETMALPAGEIFLSRFDLNLEFGVVEQPFKPTLRAATPVFDRQGKRRGVLLLNYLGQGLLSRLKQVSDAYGDTLSLVDSEGYWMLAADPEDAWGFMRDRAEVSMVKRHPRSWRQMQAQSSGAFDDSDGFWAFTHFNPREQDARSKQLGDNWLLVSHLPYEQVQMLRVGVLWQVLLFACVMLSLGMVVVLRLALAELERDQALEDLQSSGLELAQSNGELREAVEQLQRTRGALLQADKLSSLGTMVAGVAHELNTPIGAVSVAASTLRQGGQELQKSFTEGLQRSTLERFLRRNDEGLTIILGNVTRMAQLTRAFKQLASDRASTERRTFDLVELVREVMLVFALKLKQSPHRVILDLPASLMLDSYPGPLGQILQNLIDNALIHAFAPGMQGVVRVRLDHDSVTRRCLIEVQDNGCGMSGEVLAKIFDPFFTTRRGQGGTGLGLHITHQLAVDILGAELQVLSSPGQGSRFRLHLLVA